MNQDQTVVLVGKLGHGKTYLLNKICNSNELSSKDGSSITSSIYVKYSAYGSRFRIHDTPGFGTDENRRKQTFIMLSGLQVCKVNKILWVIKYDRIPNMKGDFQSNYQFLNNYLNLIILVVTHCDNCDEINKFNTIQKEFREKYGIQKFMFFSKTTTGQEICSQIDTALQSSVGMNIIITKKQILDCFKLADDIYEITQKLIKDKETLFSKFLKACDAMKSFINTFNDLECVDEVMHALNLWIKQMAKSIIRSFESDNKYTMDDLFEEFSDVELVYAYLMELKTDIQNVLNHMIQLTQERCRRHPKHFSNQIRKCIYCGTIWLKEEGCSQETTCGTTMFYASQLSEPIFTYQIIYDEAQNKIEIKKPDYIIRPEIYHKNTTNVNNQQKRVGCGAKIIWSEQPLLSNEELKLFIDAGIQDSYLTKQNDDLSQIMEFDIDYMEAVNDIKIDATNLINNEDKKQKEEQIKQEYNENIENILKSEKVAYKTRFTNNIENKVIVIGPPQSGKSTIISNINGERIQTTNEEPFHANKCCFNEISYVIIDTIGLTQIQESDKSAFTRQQKLFYNAIHGNSFNSILIVLKYKEDCKQLQQDLYLCAASFKKYMEYITLIITHFDECKLDYQQEKQRIEQTVRGMYDIQSFIYTKKQKSQLFQEKIVNTFKDPMKIDLKSTPFDYFATSYQINVNDDLASIDLIRELMDPELWNLVDEYEKAYYNKTKQCDQSDNNQMDQTVKHQLQTKQESNIKMDDAIKQFIQQVGNEDRQQLQNQQISQPDDSLTINQNQIPVIMNLDDLKASNTEIKISQQVQELNINTSSTDGDIDIITVNSDVSQHEQRRRQCILM